MRQVLIYTCSVLVFLFVQIRAQAEPPELASSDPAKASVASVPRLIQFNGAVRDRNSEPLAGVTGRLTFSVYEESQGGAALWTESQVIQLDEQGRYTVLLGATASEGVPMELFPAGKARWLGVQVENRDEDPRVLMVSVPYALKAEDAQKLGGKRASDFVLAEQLDQKLRTVVSLSVVPESSAAPTGKALAAAPAAAAPKTTPATNFADSTTNQVVSVQQNGTGDALTATTVSTTAGKAGIRGLASAATGSTIGVSGQVNSALGIAGMFLTTNTGGKILSGRSGTSPGTEQFSVDGAGNVRANAYLTLSGNGFPGTGTVTSVTGGPGLTGGTITSSGTLSLDTIFTNALYAAKTHTHAVGDVTGAATLLANAFIGNQNVQGALSISGAVGAGAGVFSGNAASPIVQVTQNGGGGGVLATTQGTTNNATAVWGIAYGTTGATNGVHGSTASPEGAGVWGDAGSSTGNNSGVTGITVSDQGTGVWGQAKAETGSTAGVHGSSWSVSGTGVMGDARAIDGFTLGVYGQASSRSGSGVRGDAPLYGVFGIATAEDMFNIGVLGWSRNHSGVGVSGQVLFQDGTSKGVWGVVRSGDGIAGVFDNESGGKLLSGQVAAVEKFRVDGSGNVWTAGGVTAPSFTGSFSGDGSGLTNLNIGNVEGAVTQGQLANEASTRHTDDANLQTSIDAESAARAAADSALGSTVGSEAAARAAADAAEVSARAAGDATLLGDISTRASLGANSFGGDQSITGNLTVTGSINSGGLRVDTTPLIPNVIGGHSANSVASGVEGATIGGGGYFPNRVTSSYGTVAGGTGNRAGNDTSVVNPMAYASVGGGLQNTASGWISTVSGGHQNTASGQEAFVGGGFYNTASGQDAAVPGGLANLAQGKHSFAAGFYAKALHDGAFVWADSSGSDYASTANNEFRVRATGGAFFSDDLTAGRFVGNGSGLTGITASSANLLDGLDSAQFLRSDTTGTLNGNLGVNGLISGQTGSFITSYPPAISAQSLAGGSTIVATGGTIGVHATSSQEGVHGEGEYGVRGLGTRAGVQGESSSAYSDAAGVRGYGAGAGSGVYGSGQFGVRGDGTAAGVYGNSTTAVGVQAHGATYGVDAWGANRAVRAQSEAVGVEGYGYGSAGVGIYGRGAIIGVQGEVGLPDSIGVKGINASGVGVQGESSVGVAVKGKVAFGEFDFGISGILGEASGGYGVHGTTSTQQGAGVLGQNTAGGTGVYGTSGGTGVKGEAGTYGVEGVATGDGYGVFGVSMVGSSGTGVMGASAGTSGIGVDTWVGGTSATAVKAMSVSTSGATKGLHAIVASPEGTAGVFANSRGGKILSGSGSGGGEQFRVDGNGDVVTTGGDFLALGAGKGIILKSPSGSTCARISLSDDAVPTLVITAVPCPDLVP